MDAAQITQLKERWDLASNAVYVLYMDDTAFIESPEFNTRREGDPRKARVRLFISPHEADLYRDTLVSAADYDIDDFVIKMVQLPELFEDRDFLNDFAMGLYDCDLNIEISRIKPDEFPESVDILWTPTQTLQ
jgi:hypothetical protein